MTLSTIFYQNLTKNITNSITYFIFMKISTSQSFISFWSWWSLTASRWTCNPRKNYQCFTYESTSIISFVRKSLMTNLVDQANQKLLYNQHFQALPFDLAFHLILLNLPNHDLLSVPLDLVDRNLQYDPIK